jgi:signal transduction histidine kinase
MSKLLTWFISSGNHEDMNFMDRHVYPLLSVWVLISLLAAYNSSLRPALPIKIKTISNQLVLVDSLLVSQTNRSDFPIIELFQGKHVTHAQEITNALHILKIGDEVTFSCAGNLNPTYKLIPHFQQPLIILNIIVGIIFYFISTLVWQFSPRREDRYFSFAGYFFGYAVMCSFTGLYIPVVSEVIAALFFFGFPAAYASLLLFSHHFPATRLSEEKWRKRKSIIQISVLILSLLLVGSFFWKTSTLSMQSITIHNNLYRVFRVFGLLSMAGSLGIMFQNGRADWNPVTRKKLQWIIGGFAFGSFPFFVFWNLPRTFGLSSPLPEWLIVLFFLLAPSGFAIAITKYRLFDIEWVLSRSLTYGIVVALLIVVYIVLMGGLSILIYDGFSLQSPYSSVLAALSVAFFFYPLQRRVQTQVDKRFFRIRYDRFQSSQRFLSELQHCTDESTLFKKLSEHFHDSVPVEGELFLKREKQKWCPLNFDAEDNQDLNEWMQDQPHKERMLVNAAHLDRVEQVPNLAAKRFPEPWVIQIPVGETIVWFLQQKSSGSRFWQEDLDLARQMARSAALQHERLYQIEKALQAEIERSQAAKMDQWKTLLVAEVAHDLRAPLNTLLWKLRNLDPDPSSGESYEKRLGDIKSHIYRLQSFIQNLLVLSNVDMDSGVKLRPLQIRLQIEEVLASLESLIADKNLLVEVACDPDLSLLGESVVFQEILLNVVQNAAKFSEAGGRVEISARMDNYMTLVGVKDTAGGMPDEVLRNLTIPIFQRSDRTELGQALDEENPKGFNLGLQISQELTKLLKGKMKIESSSRGTTVYLWFQQAHGGSQ